MARIQDGGFDVVCTDAAMFHGVLGMEVCRWVAATSPPLSLVLISGFRRGALHADGLLPKGCRINVLLAAIDEACARAATGSLCRHP